MILPAAAQNTVQKAPPAPPKKETEPAKKEEKKKPLPPTEINSDSLEYDFNKQLITFAGNVNVVDNQLELKADKMTVYLEKKTQTVNRIVATGRVKLKTADGNASGEKADYDLDKGLVVLSGEPIIHTGGGLMKGALKVVYDRTNGKFRTEGGKARLEIKDTDTKGAVDKFIRKPQSDKKKKAEPGDSKKDDKKSNDSKDEKVSPSKK